MTNNTEIGQLVDQFFKAVADHDMNQLPLADRASYSGTMLREAAEGAAAVRQYLTETVPFIKSFSLEELVIGSESAAVLVAYEAVNGVRFEGSYFMAFENGQITRIRTAFDSRPLMKGGA